MNIPIYWSQTKKQIGETDLLKFDQAIQMTAPRWIRIRLNGNLCRLVQQLAPPGEWEELRLHLIGDHDQVAPFKEHLPIMLTLHYEFPCRDGYSWRTNPQGLLFREP